MDLAEFLNARLDADETMAKATTGAGSPWAWTHTGYGTSSWALGHVQDEDDESDLSGNIPPGSGVVIDGVCESINGRPADAAHIARHDPARVLREVEAKRRILGRHERQTRVIWRDQRGVGEGPPFCPWCSDREESYPWPCPDVRALAAVYSDHPDYKAAWMCD